MTTEALPINVQEHRAILGICVLAAFADGAQGDVERARIEKIVSGFSVEQADLVPVYQQALGGQLTLVEAARQLQNPAAAALAYEMAVCVCNADGALNDTEKRFLSDLRQTLSLDAASTAAHQQTAQTIVQQPVNGAPPPLIEANRDADVDKLILNAAILNGALEIMPHTLATMAIVPLQMRMVYRIGKCYGFELDRGHIKDFVATVGVGLASQMVESFAERLVGRFARRLAGRMLGGLMGQAASSAVGFASTYALGHVAKRYYAGGRQLSAAQLKETFSSMLQNARPEQSRHSADIMSRARQVNVTDLLPLIRQQ